jgi:hypothetical protein
MKKSVAVLAVAVLAGTMSAALAGPAGAKGGGGSTTTTTAPKVTKCVTKTATQGITQAMNSFLSGNPAIAMKYIDQGAKIGASYQLSEQLDTAAGLTSATKLTLPINVKVTCKGSTKANFQYDLYMKDTTTGTTTPPLGLNQGGDALIKKGVWYVSALTVCDLEAAAGSAAAQATNQCYMAIGQPVPPAS